MKARAFLTVGLLAFGTQACGLIGGGDESAAADSTAMETPPPAETPATEANAPAVQPLPQQPVSTPPSTQLSRSPTPIEGEMPWNPEFTGVIDPGMTSAQVIATWGEPAQQRTYGNQTYLYYRNGCERSCGTFDLVILEGDQVVDAVVRGFGHDYSGVSSSPRNTTPVANAAIN